jgi:uncharacterized membrane protein/mono/diheme cytochrome c family protein
MAVRFPWFVRPGSFLLVSFVCVLALPAAAAETIAQPSDFNWTAFLGPFHHVALHFPIGLIAALAALEIAYWFRPEPLLRRIICLVMHMTTVSAIVAVVLGLMLENEGGYEAVALGNHELSGKLVAVFAIAGSVVVFLLRRNPFNRCLLGGFRLLVAGMVVSVSLAGHLGGNLAHGSTYLTKHAPAFLQRWMGAAPAPMTPKTQGSAQAIFQEHCVQCHGPDKQKGDLRLDSMDAILEGGENGEVVVPGKPMESRLVELITLPPEDDDVMPPKGKGPLTADEILTVVRWIKAGAKPSE